MRIKKNYTYVRKFDSIIDTHRPNHPIMYSGTETRTAVRGYVHAQCVAVSCCFAVSYRDFHIYDPPPHRGRASLSPGAPCHARRSPSWTAGPDLSPTTPRTAMWGGRGAIARPRGVGWRSGEPFPHGAYSNRDSFEDPKRHDDGKSIS